ncbi:MAG TPA: SPW repeat protein [Verrucomicrobiae bacterium]|jgi:hypothetical protein|nr:SPW repeat protein [Verrucomicrobiae bacterium]
MWPHIVNAVFGIWLMAAPNRLDLSQFPTQNERLLGPIVAALGVASIFEATRELRWLLCGIGIWLIFAPFVLGYANNEPLAARNEILCGGAIALVAIFRGRIRQRHGGGWKELWKRT